MSQDLVTIEIDGRTLRAPKGAMLIDVADAENIRIPRFCYHKKLSVAANCRMCLVEIEKAPKPMPACATPVMEGMKVFTRSPRALAAQKGTMEFLLINHPLDCPICDQGGECELQDVAMGYGESVSRYAEAKRVVADRDIGPLIETEMTRCIHCTRCVRFGEEIAGVRELGATGRGENMRIGTFVEHTVGHELSGNVIDLCPVGALTAKPSRYRARAWEYRQAPTVAAHDGVGSNLFVHVHNDRVMRVVPRENEAVNETWISDRDRFSYTGLYHESRLTVPRIKEEGRWRDASWEEALGRVADGLRQSAPAQVGALLSPSLTVEEFYLAQKVLRGAGVRDIDHRLRQRDFRDEAAAPLFPWLGSGIEELEQADAVLLIGCNPRREQPMLAHRLRKAALKGARVGAVHAYHLDLTYPLAASLAGDPRRQVLDLAGVAAAIAGSLGQELPAGLAGLAAAGETAPEQTAVRVLADALTQGDRVHVLLGADAIASPAFSELRALADWIAGTSGARLGYLASGANATGAWLAGILPGRGPGGEAIEPAGDGTRAMLEQGRDCYLIAGIDPERDLADPRLARKALGGAGFVVALNAFGSPVLDELADVLLPVATAFETSGTLVNAEGRWQSFHAVAPAPGEARPGWKVWRVLGNLLDVAGMDYLDSRTVRDELRSLLPEREFDNRLQAGTGTGLLELPEAAPGQALLRAEVTALYSADALVRRAGPLQQATEGKWSETLRVHPQSAGAFEDGEQVAVIEGASRTGMTLVLDNSVAPGLALTVAGAEALAGLGAPGHPVTLARD